MKTTTYSKNEITFITEGTEMGFSRESMAEFLNKRFHNGESVRTAEGIRKKLTKII